MRANNSYLVAEAPPGNLPAGLLFAAKRTYSGGDSLLFRRLSLLDDFSLPDISTIPGNSSPQTVDTVCPDTVCIR